MGEFSLSPRLAMCASFVRKGSVVADIGTDHALLPIWLVRSGIAVHAIASDINEGPIARARQNIGRCGMNEHIDTVVADGLSGISPDRASDIVIAGMGGDLIAAILDAAPWVRSERLRLILQPMSHAERLREYLFANGFRLEEENAVTDSGRVYSVMCVSYCGQVTKDDVMVYGGLLIGRTDTASVEYLCRTAAALRTRAAGLRAAGDADGAADAQRIAEAIAPLDI